MIFFDLSFANVYQQYLLCRKNKRNTVNALRFEVVQEQELLRLTDELQNRTYTPSRSVCFFASRPKLREIFAADFRDRIVHHILVDYLEQIFEPIFIEQSFACRKGKGVHAGVKTLQKYCRKVSCNGSKPAYFMQLDIANYFMSIDKTILFSLLNKHVNDANALWLTKLLVFHDCTENFTLKGNLELLKAIPAHKTLINTPNGKGLPIGNLNSQFFANVYLNALDQFIKHQLKCRYYVRYCDDFVLLANSEQQLHDWRIKIADFLQTELTLTLHKKQLIAPINNGINFLGYIIRYHYMLVRRRVVNHLKEKLNSFKCKLVVQYKEKVYYYFDEKILDQLHAVLNSYLGHFKLANTVKLECSLWQNNAWLKGYFEQPSNENKKLIRKYKTPKQFVNVKQQYNYFRWRFNELEGKKIIVLFQVGKFIEFYHQQDKFIATLLGLKPISENKRGALFGFPLTKLPVVMRALLVKGYACCFVKQSDIIFNKVMQRKPSWIRYYI
ncbi:MAG: hypothetical protein JKX76_07555 [Colwellia sp.]|nr:hypothetical protein [Colwellia sp.]